MKGMCGCGVLKLDKSQGLYQECGERYGGVCCTGLMRYTQCAGGYACDIGDGGDEDEDGDSKGVIGDTDGIVT